MTKITIAISDTEKKALNFMGEDPQEWLQQAVQTRAHKAKMNIADRFRKRANDEGIQIPVGLDNIVQEAHKRGWLKTKS